MKSKNLLQGQSIYATEEGRKKLLKIMQFYDVISSRKPRQSLSIEDHHATTIVNVLEQLGRGVPPQYILGRALFMGNTFYCTSDTLIPRPETSLLVRTAYNYIEEKRRNGTDAQTVIEIGTGCGNIAVSLAMLCNGGVKILASDISAAAVEVARRNIQRYKADSKVSLFCGDLYAPFTERQVSADMVICNPPYIPTTSLKKLARQIIDHEPTVALDGGAYGLCMFRRIIDESSKVLKPGGIIMFEIGEGQERMIERLFATRESFTNIKYFTYEDRVRVVSAERIWNRHNI